MEVVWTPQCLFPFSGFYTIPISKIPTRSDGSEDGDDNSSMIDSQSMLSDEMPMSSPDSPGSETGFNDSTCTLLNPPQPAMASRTVGPGRAKRGHRRSISDPNVRAIPVLEVEPCAITLSVPPVPQPSPSSSCGSPLIPQPVTAGYSDFFQIGIPQKVRYVHSRPKLSRNEELMPRKRLRPFSSKTKP